MVYLQQGTAQIGSLPLDSPEVGKDVTVSFPQPFGKVPVVIATPLQDPSFPETTPDIFVATLIKVTTRGFLVRVRRQDLMAPWGQNLLLNWIAIG